jgi:tetratricopeptide (TPR) repeat protein
MVRLGAMHRAGLACGVLIVLLEPRTAAAAGEFVEDVRVSRRGEEATIAIELACPMRLQSDVMTPSGVSVELRVAPLDSCRQLGVDITSELYRPPSGQLAHLVELEYHSLGLGDSLLALEFDRPVAYRIAQRGDLRTLELRVRSSATQPNPTATGSAATAAPALSVAAPTNEPPAERAPLSARVRAPALAADYVINLQSTREPIDPAAVGGVPVGAAQHLYVSTTQIDGIRWYRLRLGFFASEAAARAELEELTDGFPRAWIGRADASELQSVDEQRVERGDGGVELATGGPAAAASAAGAAAGSLPPERIESLLTEARAAIIGGDFDTAIRNYARLLEEPGEHAAESRENLGLAREKKGQTAHAAAEYRRFLTDYPQHAAVPRVEQRLNGLVTANVAPRERLRTTESIERKWDFTTGISQYYRHDVNRIAENQPELTTLSALFTDLDWSVGHSGTSTDWRGRITLSHMNDLTGEGQRGPGDQQRISYAYLDLTGVETDWSLRFGRQTLHNWGVLGRFDGAHATYDWAPARRVHVMTGFPVESTRDSVETSREFVGVAVDFERLVGEWTVSPYVTRQTIEGIRDRQAVGVDLRYFDERRTLASMVDYDVDYGALNTLLVLGTWRVTNRLTLTGLVDRRASPVLTTRNALIGQPVGTIEELLLVWTEDEIRQIARDRTADSGTVTLGLATPIAERWQVNADITRTEIGDGIASAGVAAIPGTGAQTYYSASFVGSALFATSDVSVFTLRAGESAQFSSSQLMWDLRIPLGRRLRLNPRVSIAVWDGTPTGVRRQTVTPSLRLLLNNSRHYRLEMEAGTHTVTRTDPRGEQKATGRFLNLGYRADF